MPLTPASSNWKPAILVVDDDEDNAQLLESALEFVGYAVKVARSCAEARTVLESSPIDALVTDFSLGDCTALELLESLGNSRPPVAVLVTGHGRTEDKARSHAAGFQAHLVKPIAVNELDRLLREALAARSSTTTPLPSARRHRSEPPPDAM